MAKSRFTVISWCTTDYKYLSEGLKQDCEKFSYDFHLYEVDKDYPSLMSAWSNHPHIIKKGVEDFGTVLFLDVECRIVNPIPEHWTAPLVSVRSPEQKFWIKFNTGTVMADKECLPWLEAWIEIIEKWDMANLEKDDYIHWTNDLCDELAFNAAVTALGVELTCPKLEYIDRNTSSEIVRGLWKTLDTIIQHPTIHHWPKEESTIECKKLFVQNFPGKPDEIAPLFSLSEDILYSHGWCFNFKNNTYAPEEFYEDNARIWIEDRVYLTSKQR